MGNVKNPRSQCTDRDWSGRAGCGHCSVREAASLAPHAAESLDRFLKPVKTVVLAPHAVLFHEGDSAETVFTIRRGLVKLLSYLPNGRPRIVRLHGRGDALGMEGLLKYPYEHSAVAVREVEVCCIPVAALRQLRKEKPDLYCHVMERWHSYLQHADTWITEFSTGSVRARVARLVSFLSHIETDMGPGKVALLGGEDMAAILGVTAESVSRVIAELKRENVLRHVGDQPHELYESDDSALRELARD